MDAPNLDAPLNAVNQQKTATQGLLAGQQGLTSDFLDRYKNTIGGQETASQLYTRLGAQQNLPTLQKNAFNTQQTLYDLPSTYSKATTGFDVNANQLSRLVGQKTSELAPVAQRAQDEANFAQNSVDKQMGFAQQDQAKQLLPFDKEQSFLSDYLARQTSLFSQNNESELNALSDKVKNGIALSEGEKNRAQELLMQEKTFNNQKALNQQQADLTKESNKGQDRYITLGDGATLYDTLTGKVVSENTKNFSGGAGETFS